ncbi:hypothetical protein HMPREF1549_01318 [Actinomyces johnsonii F0510]|uniref:Uncharacterized protein n=1 Tax=Actinomyces johnsonii F0510 TaxID=1227262 RepID=U1PWC5_9ACTO|nr:hypothetical protein HMPREF1549_01318 [Actinomyces johnsonii F0510]
MVCAKCSAIVLCSVYYEPARRPWSGAEYQPFVRLCVRDLRMF